MSGFKHTKGPWVKHGNRDAYVTDTNGNNICMDSGHFGGGWKSMKEADGTLSSSCACSSWDGEE